MLVSLLITATQTSSTRAADQNWLKQCPTLIDQSPGLNQPKTNKFTFTGTQQVFIKIDAFTGKPISDETMLIGCYADFAGLNGATPNGYHVGAINRDDNGFYWINAAGVSWRLTLDSSQEFLETGDANPYKSFGDRFVLVDLLSGINYRSRGAFGMVSEVTSDSYRAAWVGTQAFPIPPTEYSYGFSFYTSVWPLFKETIKNVSASAGVTWIYPRADGLSHDEKNSLCSFPYGMQSMEGGLAWAWDQFKFPTILPKFKLNPIADCYQSDAPTTPFWTFAGSQLTKGKLSTLIVSNQILVAPDGFTFDESSAGGMLGVATMATPFNLLTPQTDRETGANSWMVLLNTSSFKGPIAIYPAQLFSSFSKGNPLRQRVSFDNGSGFLTSAALEWGGMPFVEYKDKDGSIYSKIPALQFPADANGETVVMSDFKSYSKSGFYDDFGKSLEGKIEIPTKVDTANAVSIKMKAPTYPLFQSGKSIDPFSGGVFTELDSGNAFGFRWNKASKVIELPTVYKQVGNSRIKVEIDSIPKELNSFSFQEPAKPAYSYQTPSWWKNEGSTPIQKIKLNDGSSLEFVWIRFVDQPGIDALKLSESEKMRLQQFVVGMHRSWSHGKDFIAGPSKGLLATVDEALLVKPPVGMEFGYVPLVISQLGTPNSQIDTGLLNAEKSLYQKYLKEISKAKQEAEAKAAAELKAKQEAEAKAAAVAAAKAAAVKKQVSITCNKGKLTKKIIRIKPKCPAGYKKK